MSLEVILSFIIASLILGLIPGPSVCFTIAQSMKNGIRGTFPSIFGQITANAVQLTLTFIGLSEILEQSIILFFVLKIAGAVYLVYLGIKQFFAEKPVLNKTDNLDPKNRFRRFLDGFIICGTNPKAIIFFTAFLPQFISIHFDYTTQFIILGITNMLVCGTVLTFYSIIAGKARFWLLNNNYWRFQNRIIGSLMIGAGLTLAFLQKK